MIPAALQPLASHLWQSTVFAIAIALATMGLRKNSPRTRYHFWLAASLKFVIPFSMLVTMGSHFGRPAALTTEKLLPIIIEPIGQAFDIKITSAPIPPRRPPAQVLPHLLAVGWSIGFAGMVFSWWRKWRKVRAAAQEATPLLLLTGVDVRSSPWVHEPGVFGARRPILLLPDGITGRLTASEMESILAHELCHIRHRDNIATAVHMAVEAVFWFYPVIWWLGARLIEERERSCDEEVLRMGNKPEIYAAGILKVCELYLESPLRCMAGVTGPNLKTRIEAIMANRIALRLNLTRRAVLTLAGLAAVAAPTMVGIVNSSLLLAQSSQATAPRGPSDAFEVAAIKPTPADWRGGRFLTMQSTSQFVARNHTLKNLVAAAYNVNPHAISGGPAWIDSDVYDIFSKTPGTVRPNLEQQMSMLRNLLSERFALKLHREPRELSHFALTVAKNGPKLNESTLSPDASPEGPPPLVFRAFPELIRLPGRYATMAELASVLQRAALDRPVVDRTGLSGRYDFDLEWTPDTTQFDGALSKTDGNDDAAKPGLFEAIQEQLGLRLEATKGPIETLVVDHAERPSRN